MAVRIRSLAVSGPLLVPLSSGATVRLSPGEATSELDDVDVANNAKIDKLSERRLIDVESVSDEAEGTDQDATDDVTERPTTTAPRRGSRSGKP
jgi:hypothetical protein